MNKKTLYLTLGGLGIAALLCVGFWGGFWGVMDDKPAPNALSEDGPAYAPEQSNPWNTNPADHVPLGTFEGILPCADCQGIQTSLTLTKYGLHIGEGIYQLRETRLGENSPATIAMGNWTTLRGHDQDENAVVYQLNPDRPETSRYFEKIGDDALRPLDAKGHVIVSDGAASDLMRAE
jgi:hypothetical protein